MACLPGDHERAEAEDRDERPHRLLDPFQLFAQHRREEEREREADHRSDQAEDRAEEPGAGAGNSGEQQYQDDERVEEIHPALRIGSPSR
jgi:hypothetical protein